MPKSASHRRAQAKAAGRLGRKEVRLGTGRVLDARTSKTATEVERSRSMPHLRQAARRLNQSRAPRKVLQVPQHNMSKATAAMRTEKVRGTVKNMSGSKRRSVT